MPNKEGGYGGYRSQPQKTGRKVNAPGSGKVRRGVDPAALDRNMSAGKRTQTPGRAPQRQGGPAGPQPVRREPAAQPARRDQTARTGGRTAPYRAQRSPGNTPPRRPRRRADKRVVLLATVAGILVLSGIITLLLPQNAGQDLTAVTEETAQAGRLVAPVPYANAGEDGSAVPSIDWGTVGPVQQTETYTFTAAPEESDTVPEFGRVTTEWFSDAAFLGDSLTSGLAYYGINVGGALILGYEGASPNQIVNRTALINTNEDDAEQVPLDILAERQPAKLYLLIGTNALAGTGNDEGFLAYYGRLLDELQTTLPDSMIFVQSVLNVRPEALEQAPGLTPERVSSMNDSIRAMCAERGLYYLNLTEAFTGEDGYLSADYAQTDGIHLTVSGYTRWVDYLCTHVPYSKENPYQQGSTYYLSDELRQLIADLP